jgi:hypothetical protein
MHGLNIFGKMFLETNSQDIYVFWGIKKSYINHIYSHLLTKLKQD